MSIVDELEDEPMFACDDAAAMSEALDRRNKTIGRLTARVEELERVLKPFAKAGELFKEPTEYDIRVYNPAAGDEYALCGEHLRQARSTLEASNQGGK